MKFDTILLVMLSVNLVFFMYIIKFYNIEVLFTRFPKNFLIFRYNYFCNFIILKKLFLEYT